MSKGLKTGLIIGAILLAIVAIYYLFFSGSGKWTIKSKTGTHGTLAETQGPGITVTAAQSYADSKGYKAFFIDGGGTVYYFKTADSFSANTGGDSYVKS